MTTTMRRRARRPEHDHERGALGPFYGSMGITVNCTSARVWAKGVTPGIPDLVLQWPVFGGTFYHETKIRIRQTKDQYEFELRAKDCATPYILGDISSAFDFVEWLGVAWRVGVGDTVQFYPKHEWPARVRESYQDSLGNPHWAVIARAWFVSEQNRKHHERWGFRE